MSNWSLFTENQGNNCSNFYSIPMNASASIQTNFEMQNKNKNMLSTFKMQNKNISDFEMQNRNRNTSNFNSVKKHFQNVFNNSEFVSSAIYGGMSLWFLVLAVLICVVLFSHH
jgi:hypothetical protein